MNLGLEEIKNGVPTCTSFSHWTFVQRESRGAHLKAEGNPVALENGRFNFMHHLPACADIDVFGGGGAYGPFGTISPSIIPRTRFISFCPSKASFGTAASALAVGTDPNPFGQL